MIPEIKQIDDASLVERRNEAFLTMQGIADRLGDNGQDCARDRLRHGLLQRLVAFFDEALADRGFDVCPRSTVRIVVLETLGQYP